ncbi:uncharacterized protein LOC128545840 [Mercenaria mercenaria]|uniref:uncharacterized protein LOC128545840 n=1 Tax=Mercenaria mercenaria TaxID=6596 RepID=UPI00234F3310|nr:uncharacterized protein LOC128545840 [Mercenaria mercenaria]
MSNDPDYFTYMSKCLSEVLNDIDLKEDMVLRGRRAWLLRESLMTIASRLKGLQQTVYMFGSLTEGATTQGLISDNVCLICNESVNILTDSDDWKPGHLNLMSIHDASTPPGYCLLRRLPFENLYPHFTSQTFDVRKWVGNNSELDCELDGPSIRVKGQPGYNDQDMVFAFRCKTWPTSAQKWFTEEGIGRWPTKEIKSFAANSGCFLVGVGSKGSEMEKYEYRISFSQVERCLMFSLNITQIRCYVLMKMIIKTFIHPDGDSVISSYICKTVLFHCIKHTYSNLWQESKLLYCLTLCLSVLQYCVLSGNCPHFIIHENNLLSGRVTAEFRTVFIEQMRRIILDRGIQLKYVNYDDFGHLLQCKMQNDPLEMLLYSAFISRNIAVIPGALLRDTGKCIQDFHKHILYVLKHKEVNTAIRYIRKCISQLVSFHGAGSKLKRIACKFLAAVFSSTLGSLTASCSISSSSSVSSEALKWFDASLDSDVSSSRLKKASAFFCAGDMNATYLILEDIRKRYDLNMVEPVCRCTLLRSHPAREGFKTSAHCHNEGAFKHVAAFCVKFLRCESCCVPKELQYEMYRSTLAERPLRHDNNQWLDLAVIDSLTYLLFLRYKTCGRLGKHTEQKQALNDLVKAIDMEPNLGHRETALSLVGQILEEEGKLTNALRFFIASFNEQPENNAAKMLICKLLSKIINSDC